MSAGGLWSTFLSMERSDALATAFIMSGGTGMGMAYKPLDHQMPVILAWGGPNDTYNTGSFTIYFEDTTRLRGQPSRQRARRYPVRPWFGAPDAS